MNHGEKPGNGKFGVVITNLFPQVKSAPEGIRTPNLLIDFCVRRCPRVFVNDVTRQCVSATELRPRAPRSVFVCLRLYEQSTGGCNRPLQVEYFASIPVLQTTVPKELMEQFHRGARRFEATQPSSCTGRSGRPAGLLAKDYEIAR